MNIKSCINFILPLALISLTSMASTAPQPLLDAINTPVSAVKNSNQIKLPMISWGGEALAIHANGNQIETQPNSLFAQAGLNIKLVRQDNFKQQLKEYIAGETPFLRCTLGMCNQAIELLSQDPRTKPVIIYQMTWSKGGDGLVAKKGLKNVKYLKGKTISLQVYGPHVDFLTAILEEKHIALNEVTIDWQPHLTLSEDSPPAAFLHSNIDAAFMVLPDALTLTSNRRIGSGKRGSVKGAKLITSTLFANRIIADVYVVRSDYFQKNRTQISKLVSALIQSQSEVSAIMKQLSSNARQELLASSAAFLLDDKNATAPMEELILDAEFISASANKDFLQNSDFKYYHQNINQHIQKSFNSLALINGLYPFPAAQWLEGELK